LLYARLRASSDMVIQSMVGHSFAPRAVGVATQTAVVAMKARRSSAVILVSLIFLKLGSDRAKCKARRASTGNATTLAEYRKAPCNYLNDKEAGQGPRFASISLERHGCISVRFTGKMPEMRENSATLARQPIVELTLGRRETACGSAGRHADPAFDEGT
jgi:hypothetical protein